MKTKLLLTAWLLACMFAQRAVAQAPGDYKSNGTGGGAWNNAATWLTFDGTAYVPATAAPTSTAIVKVQAPDSVVITAAETITGLSVDSAAFVTVAAGKTVTLNSDITINGGFFVNGAFVSGSNTVAGKGHFRLNAGASITIGSPNGIAISGPTGNIQTATRYFSPAANYTYASTAAQITGNGLPANITGTITDDNRNAAAGLTLSQNISVNSTGRFVVPGSGVLSCKGNTIINGSGSFALNSGAVFYIGHAGGISTTANTGAVQVTGSKIFSADATYIYNGSTTQATGNAVPQPFSGMLVIANTNADGCVLSNDIVVNTPGQVFVTGALACATFTISGTGSFLLNTGGTLLTGHPLGLSATGASGSIQTSTITYSASANYVFNGTAAQSTGNGLPAAITSLAVNSSSTVGVWLTNDVTITGNLNLAAGTLCLNSKTLTIGASKTITRKNGSLSLCGGSLVYAGPVNITYTSTIDLSPGVEMPVDPSKLINLTIALASGKTLTLTSPVTVNSTVTMTSGNLAPSANLTYGPNASLVYNGTTLQTPGAEWPDNFTTNISIRNSNTTAGFSLNTNKAGYSGTLTVRSGGYFNTGNVTLSGPGNIVVQAGGTFMTPHAQGVSPEGAIKLTGTRTFATGSNYTFNGTAPQVTGGEMPLSVANLTINNTGANRIVILSNAGTGTQTITGTLALTSGVFDLHTNSMNLLFHASNTPISRTTGKLWLSAASSLQFGTADDKAGALFTIPNDLFSSNTLSFKNLTINRTNALTLGNQNLTLNGTLELQAGILDLARTTLTFQNSDVPVLVDSGSLTVGSQASLQFGAVDAQGGAAFTLPDFLFTTPPTFANLTVNRANPLTLGTQNLTITGALTLTNGTVQIGNSTLNLQGTIQTASGSLQGGMTSSLEIGGTGSSLTLPAIKNGLNGLVITRPDTKAAPAVRLGANLNIYSILRLSGGSLALDTSDLVLETSATILNADAQHFIYTTNTPRSGGALVQYVGNEPVLFPVGTTSYTPAWVATADTLRAFRVRVFNGIQSSDTSGITYAYSNDAVNKTWVIEKVVKDSAKASITLQWNASDENISFNRDKSFISSLTAAQWDTTSASPARDMGTGIYTQTRTSLSQFNRFSVQEDRTVRAAKWLAFSAERQDQEILLQWTVGNGKGLSRFVIERSANGQDFSTIGTIAADSTDDVTTSYLFTDPAPQLYQPRYYRLKQLMADGQFEYSELLKVVPDQIVGSFVYPVPFQNQLNIALYAERSGMVSVYIIDISGKLIKKHPAHLQRGNNVITLPMQDVPKGMYVVQVIGDQVLWESHKIVK